MLEFIFFFGGSTGGLGLGNRRSIFCSAWYKSPPVQIHETGECHCGICEMIVPFFLHQSNNKFLAFRFFSHPPMDGYISILDNMICLYLWELQHVYGMMEVTRECSTFQLQALVTTLLLLISKCFHLFYNSYFKYLYLHMPHMYPQSQLSKITQT